MHLFLAFALLSPAAADMGGTHAVGKHVDRLILRSAGGEVTVRVDDSLKRAEVVAVDRRPGRSCHVTVEEERRRSQVTFGPKPKEDPSACRADLEVRLPPGVALTIELGVGEVHVPTFEDDLSIRVRDGNVRLGSVTGDLTVEVTAGDVELGPVIGRTRVAIERGSLTGSPAADLDASIGEGRIALDGLRAPVRADTGIGNIQLGFAAPPPGQLILNAGHGHIVVDLPDGTPVRPEITTWSGTRTIDLPIGDGLDVVAVASMGSIRLH